MAHSKSRLKKTRALISIKTYKRPMLFVILMMVMINITILAVAALIALIIDDTYQSFLDAFTNGSVKWMLTPNAILAIEKPQTLALAVLVLITGLVLFSGTIIALTTNAIKDYFAKKQSGSGKIYLENHIVVLNWNNKVPELVADLLYVSSRHVTLIILADIDKAYAEKQIANAVDKVSKHRDEVRHLNVLVKRGDPLLRSDLEDISIHQAEAVLIMNKEIKNYATQTMTESDLNIIKTILSLGQLDLADQLPIVAEIKCFDTKLKIETMSQVVKNLAKYRIIPICFDRRLGQIMAQTIIEKHIEDVYLSVFSLEGSEVYRLRNQTFEYCLKHHSHAIPLGRVGEDIFVLSSNNKTKLLTSEHAFKPLDLNVKPLVEKSIQDVYIIGENNKLSFILESFKAYERLYKSLFHVELVSIEDVLTLIEPIKQSDRKVTFLLLSDETKENEALDANVIDTLIYLEGALKDYDVHIIVELLDPKNDRIIKDFNIENTIISNKIISLLLSKLALFPETAEFYEDLLTIEPNDKGYDEQSVVVHTAMECFDQPLPITFDSVKQAVESLYSAYQGKVALIGRIIDDQVVIFDGDHHHPQPLTIDKDDQLIFLKI